MATKKVFEVDETSIVDLKAELFRKEQQFRQAAVKTSKPTDSSKKKLQAWSKQPKNTASQSSRAQQVQDNVGQSEDEKFLQKSRQMLEAKAALYEKMAKGEIEENEEDLDSGEGRFLVDFHKKIHDSEAQIQQDNKEDSEDIGPSTPPPSCPEEEWVDYVDSLGRSRKCLRKDLKELQERDQELLPKKSPSPPTLLSDDMRREMMRTKWEEEEEKARNQPVGPVHYQSIQFDEVRHHGVGYYQFSKVEEQRQKQMDTLRKLREETLEQRSRTEKIKDRRRAALESRLAKVRARKSGQTGESTADGTEDESIEENDIKNAEKIDSREEKEQVYEERVKASTKRQLPEWAQHKKGQTDIGNTYLKKRREERDKEFAPPLFYYDTSKDCQQETDRKPWWDGKGKRLSTKEDDSTAGNTSKDKQHVQQCPPYPSITGNVHVLQSFQPPQPCHNYPPLSLQENLHYPPAPLYPPFHPPPWQQARQEVLQQTGNKVSMAKEHLVVSERTNSTPNPTRTQASMPSVITLDGNTATPDQMISDFVSGLRPKS